MPKVNLRHAHPMFYVSVLGDLLVWWGAGATLLLGPDEWVASPAFDAAKVYAPMRAWGALLVAVGVMLAYGVGRTWRWARYSMQVGVVAVAALSVGFIVAVAQGKNAGAFGLWFLLAFGTSLLAQLGEPPSNPASARRP